MHGFTRMVCRACARVRLESVMRNVVASVLAERASCLSSGVRTWARLSMRMVLSGGCDVDLAEVC